MCAKVCLTSKNIQEKNPKNISEFIYENIGISILRTTKTKKLKNILSMCFLFYLFYLIINVKNARIVLVR